MRTLALTFLLAGCAAKSPVPTPSSDRTVGWGRYGRTYDNQRFAPLEQINRDNVHRLAPAWIYQTGLTGTFQTSPLVEDGVMYITTPRNHVVALDAVTGEERWRYRHEMASEALCCGPANKGAALGHGKVYTATADGRLVALDKATGALVWDILIAARDSRPTETLSDLADDDPRTDSSVQGSSGLGANMAPIVFEDLVIVGVTGAGYGLHLGREAGGAVDTVIGFAGTFGRRGYLAAYNAESGEEVWRWYTTAADGWEGEWKTQTPDGAPLFRNIPDEKARQSAFTDAWQVGGGSLWSTPALDPERGVIYLGTGNPAPQLEDTTRPGDNLYTVSVVALEARTGKMRWYYQQVPHDLWGYDAASPPILFNLSKENETVPAVAQASKTGWVYINDRETGNLLLKSEAFVPQSNLFQRPTSEGIDIAPGAAGGSSWSPTAHDPTSGMIFIAGIHMPTRYTTHQRPAADDKPPTTYTSLEVLRNERWGTLTAIDTNEGGRVAWQQKTDDILVGGVLATAGGLVFMGEGSGQFAAYDSSTGEQLWSFNCGAGVNAPPISYMVDGQQYVAVAAGGHSMFGFPPGGALVVFALPK